MKLTEASVGQKIKVYIAGPFFRPGERERLEKLREVFSNDTFFLEYEFFFPMDHFIPDGDKMSNLDWAKKVFKMDTSFLEQSDIVVAIYDKHYSDSGTAWELGYAYGLGIPVILLCTDLKADNSIMPIVAANKIYDFNKFIEGKYWDIREFDFETLR